MSEARSSTVGLVLSTTTERPTCSAASTSCACLLARFLLFRIRSLLTSSWVAAQYWRKKVLLPEACRPIKITNSITHESCLRNKAEGRRQKAEGRRHKERSEKNFHSFVVRSTRMGGCLESGLGNLCFIDLISIKVNRLRIG